MTSDAPRALALVVLAALAATGPALAAEAGYPFEGTWIRANRVCAPNAPHTRTYTAKEVTFSAGHCNFRKVVSSGSQFEIFEECRRSDRSGPVTERIRMIGPDLMQMRRQVTRLKIPRPLRFTRCTVAAQPAPGGPKPAPLVGPHRGPSVPAARSAEPREGEPRDGDDHLPKPGAPKP